MKKGDKMNEVPCGYCEHFKATKEERIGNHDYVVAGECLKFKTEVKSDGKVCKDFSLATGVTTSKKVPDYCGNKNWVKLCNGKIKAKKDEELHL